MDDIKIKQLEAEANLYQSLGLQLLANGHGKDAARDFCTAASRWKKLADHYRKIQGIENISLRPE